MSAYSIFTVCTQNYRDAYDFTIDSWLATAARHIYVYTDDPTWVAGDDRISILPVFSVSASWLTNVGRKAQAFRSVLDETPCEDMVFLDADCYVLSEIGDVFGADFDLAVSRFERRKTVSSGVWFSRNNQGAKDFADAWLKKQEEFKSARIGYRAHVNSYSQKAFDCVLRQADRDGSYRILKLPYNMYSLKVKDCSKLPKARALKLRRTLFSNLREKRPKILHFYNNSYRNGQLRKDVFDALATGAGADGGNDESGVHSQI